MPIPITSIFVFDFVNTGECFRQYWRSYIFKDFANFEGKFKDPKNMFLEIIMHRYEIKNKRIEFATQVFLQKNYFKVPL